MFSTTISNAVSGFWIRCMLAFSTFTQRIGWLESVGIQGQSSSVPLCSFGLVTIMPQFPHLIKLRHFCNPLFPYQVYSALSVSYLLSSESGNCCLVAKSCLTLCHPMDCSPPGYSIHGISQARILERVAISFSKGSSWPRDWTFISCIGRQVPYHWATREAHPVRAKNL